MPHRGPSPAARSLTPLAALLLSLSACTGGGAGQDEPVSAAEARNVPAAAAAGPGPQPGKYGCAESIPRLVNGSFEYNSEGRGFITLEADGRYTDPAGVPGSYRYDQATEESRFSGGALDGAVATPLEGEGPRLWVVIPTESGERRWSCSLV